VTRRTVAVAALLFGGVCAGQPSKPPSDVAKVYTGKVVPAKGGGLALVAGDGTATPIVEDAGSAMLFQDRRLQNRPVRLTALLVPATKSLRVVKVQTVKDGKAYDVDYWCEICQISGSTPGKCVCCGDDTEFRERPAP